MKASICRSSYTKAWATCAAAKVSSGRQASKALAIAQALSAFVIASALLGLGPRDAFAQRYPARPIRLVVPFAPGGGTDVVARRIAVKLSEALGQQLVVDNRGGGGGTIGGDIVAHAAPDGYTLIMVSGSYAVNPSLHKLTYDPVGGITPIALIGTSADLAVVHPNLPVHTTRELIDHAKSHPGKINYGSTGVGGFTHLATELFKMMTQVDITHVPYKGTGPAMSDLLAGQVQVLFGGIASELPHVRTGRLRAIAVTTPKRLPSLPEIPAVAETVPGYEAVLWYGMLGPRGLPRGIVDRLNAHVRKIIDNPDTKAALSREGVEAEPMAPEALRAFIKAEIDKWAKVVKAAGIRAE
ncbi:MAG: tripartite tricarboxylate transporter substrate binding protein [Rhodospirillaceae bacterium]